MEAKLIVIGGKASKDAITLRLPAVIGRSREADLTVAHPMVSRRHCEVFEVDGLLMIRDLGSLNGIVIQGQRVTEAPLCPDDEFTVGPLTFRAEYEYDGDLDAVPSLQVHEKGVSQPDAEAPDLAAVSETPTGESAETGHWATDDQQHEPEPMPPPPHRDAPAGAAEPAQAIDHEKVDALPDFFTTINSDADQPSGPQSADEDFDEFLKGFQ